MIKQPTVFILGAGASAPYNFPTGDALRKDICEGIVQRSLLKPLMAAGFQRDEIDAFGRDFQRSLGMQIDAFIAQRKEFAGIGKAAIAIELIKHELEEHITRVNLQNSAECWYSMLVRAMLAPTPEQFRQNAVSFLTFNYDRSLEMALTLACMAWYRLDEASSVKLIANIPIIHLHGDLGSLCETDARYRPYSPNHSIETLKVVASGIRLMNERTQSPEVAQRVEFAIDNANRICFLGFAFDPFNLDALQLHRATAKSPHGTARGLNGTERGRIITHMERRYGMTLSLDEKDRDCAGFLNERNIFAAICGPN